MSLRALSLLDWWVDYIPVVSSATNASRLFLKYAVIPHADLEENFTLFIKNKSTYRSAAAMVPVFGNIALFWDDWNKRAAFKKSLEKMDHDMAERFKSAAEGSYHLDLSNFILLKTLPEEFGFLSHIRTLTIDNNEFTSLPKLFPYLTTLSMSNNSLSSFPPAILDNSDLKYLGLQHNNITSLPREIGNLTKLVGLDLGHNRLTELPAEINTKLKQLSLQFNHITSFHEIMKLHNLTHLFLSANPISSLPPEIGRLKNLVEFEFAGNNLTALPSEIGLLPALKRINLADNNLFKFPVEILQLSALKSFSLAGNNLNHLPPEINKLTHLEEIDLSRNNLQNFPHEIVTLTKLKTLLCDHNELSSLPGEIDRLIRLKILWLSNNALTSLPHTLGNLYDLQKIEVEGNPHLSELPMSLGQIPGLTNITIDKTAINPEKVQLILKQCQAVRKGLATYDVLTCRLEKWMKMGNGELPIIHLSHWQIEELNEWLVRLERTNDFAHCQAQLAGTVCSILADAARNKAFKELFFTQISVNNACCEDRAAMALNEIYTSWKITFGAGKELMTGAAKTLCLRKALANKIKNELESVEIFLYYEIHLQKRLNLVTAISRMQYGEIGKRSWIDEESLIQDVNQNYFEELYELPIFQKLLLEDSAITTQWEEIDEAFNAKLEAAGDEFRQGEIMLEWKQTKMAIANKWYHDTHF